MALLLAMAIRDEALGMFNRPYFVPTRGVAIRAFMDECNREAEDNAMRKHPKDFSLFQVGSYEEETGQLVAIDVPVRLCQAVDFIDNGG